VVASCCVVSCRVRAWWQTIRRQARFALRRYERAAGPTTVLAALARCCRRPTHLTLIRCQTLSVPHAW
jgi:hypothetical protein